jgi:4,5-DOPA dioxygenase extradiol
VFVVNTDQTNPLIYDFYGFPKHFYTQTFQSRGDRAMLEHIKHALGESELKVGERQRGLDHGVWGKFSMYSDCKGKEY